MYDGDGETPVRLTGTVLDITERKQIEERQLILMAELDHRVKNILANVGAIAKLSSKNSGSVSGFVEPLEARIQAISKAHSMLRRDSWIGVDLRTYLSELLSPFISKRSHNIVLKGDEAIGLSPKAAQSLALVFHELATNAVKYGALSVPDGNVILSWSKVKERKGGVRLTWREQGGPRPIKVVFIFEGDIEGTGKGSSAAPGITAFPNFVGDRTVSLPRLRILLVEDELLLGLQAQTELETAGHKVIGFATSLEQGMQLAQDLDFDFALLDIRLGHEDSVSIAEKLLDRKVPFVFVTGFEDDLVLPTHLRSVPRFAKPYSISVILESIVHAGKMAEQKLPSLSAAV